MCKHTDYDGTTSLDKALPCTPHSFLILYIHTKSLVKTAIVLSAIPFALVGSVWLMDYLGYNWSVAVWVGVIALAGLAVLHLSEQGR